MAKGIDEILSDEKPEETEQAAEEVAEVEAKEPETTEAEPDTETVETKEDRPRNEKGQFTSKAESEEPEKEEPPKDDEPKDQPNDWTYAAYKDKSEQARKWREQAEANARELAEARQQLQQREEQQQAPDVIENPEAYNAYWQDRQAQFEQRIKFENSMQIAHMQHGEAFEEAYQDAVERANRGDKSIAYLMQSPNPGAALVAWHKREKAAQEIGDDPSAYRERVRQEIEASVRQELEAKAAEEQVQQPKPVMPTGLAGTRSVGSRSGPAWGGPKPLTDIL